MWGGAAGRSVCLAVLGAVASECVCESEQLPPCVCSDLLYEFPQPAASLWVTRCILVCVLWLCMYLCVSSCVACGCVDGGTVLAPGVSSGVCGVVAPGASKRARAGCPQPWGEEPPLWPVLPPPPPNPPAHVAYRRQGSLLRSLSTGCFFHIKKDGIKRRGVEVGEGLLLFHIKDQRETERNSR